MELKDISYLYNDLLIVPDGKKLLSSEVINHLGELSPDKLMAILQISQDNTLIELLSKKNGNLAENICFFRAVLASSLSGILIKNFISPSTGTDLSRALFLMLCLGLGKPINHQTAKDSLVWDITPRKTNDQKFKTFSEHSYEAPLHTDSQYSEFPEKFIGLLVYRKANCGGGKTRILNGYKLFCELMATDKGRKTIKLLSTHKLPFMIPPVFSEKLPPEFMFAPVFSPEVFIRYRKDTLIKGINSYGDMFSDAVINAIGFLDEIIENSPDIIEIMLENGDLLITNNHTTLHARTEFRDLERLLFRIRFNLYCSCAMRKAM